MQYDNYRFRCSSLGYIMTEDKEKSYEEVHAELAVKKNELLEKTIKLENEIEATKNKETKTFAAKQESLSKALIKLIEISKQVSKAAANLGKPKELPESVKTHLIDLFIASHYGRRSILKSKYLDKGNAVEEESITMYCIVNQIYSEKNIHRANNEYVEGEYDLDHDEIVVDTKSSWDIWTFYRNLSKPVKKLYWWQLQGYMWLFGFKKARLAYCLINTPKKFIEQEKKNALYSFLGSEEEYNQLCADIEKNMTYDDISIDERVIHFDFEVDEEAQSKIMERIIQCREFLQNLYDNRKNYNYVK